MKEKEMNGRAEPIPNGVHTLTPHLVVKGPAKPSNSTKTPLAREKSAAHLVQMENLSCMLNLKSAARDSCSSMSFRRWIVGGLKSSAERPSAFTCT
jgi:hypothetical protein